jgi:serine/threonine protein kinase
VVIFNLLTGQNPFDTANLAQLLQRVASEDPPRPSQRTNSPITPALDQLVFDCLARDPARRPASVSEILAALDRDLSVLPWTSEHAHQWWRTHMARPEIRDQRLAEQGGAPGSEHSAG